MLSNLTSKELNAHLWINFKKWYLGHYGYPARQCHKGKEWYFVKVSDLV